MEDVQSLKGQLAIDFKCRKCKGYHKNVVDQKEILHYDVETVTVTYIVTYIGDGINSGGQCDVAVTSRTRIGWVKFRECQDLLRKKIVMEIKGIVCKS